MRHIKGKSAGSMKGGMLRPVDEITGASVVRTANPTRGAARVPPFGPAEFLGVEWSARFWPVVFKSKARARRPWYEIKGACPMFKKIHIRKHERGLWFRKGDFHRLLMPGSYFIWRGR